MKIRGKQSVCTNRVQTDCFFVCEKFRNVKHGLVVQHIFLSKILGVKSCLFYQIEI